VSSPPIDAEGARLDRVAVDSAIGSLWTLVSRVSGLVRVVAVAAVLGPTHFGNLYQATNLLPNLTFELLTGALFGSLVVPAVVRHLDADDRQAAARLASGFLTMALFAGAAVVLLCVAAGPLVLRLLTAGVPPGEAQTGLGPAWLLLTLLLLQVPCYAVVGMAASVQQARGRFAIAAGAPTVENIGIVVTLGLYAWVFGVGTDVDVGMAHVALLGGGTTAAVALHAAVQWLAARHFGVTLTLSNGFHDSEVRGLCRLAIPSSGNAALNVSRYFCILVVAAAVPGGVVALTLAINFYNLPVALGARTVAQAALPGLSRAYHRLDDVEYGRAFNRACSLVLFLTCPAAVGYALLAEPFSVAVAFGEMAGPTGRELIRYSLLGVSLGIAGDAVLALCTQASYARRDGTRPMLVVGLRTVVGIVGMLVSRQLFNGAILLLAIGLCVSVGDLLAALVLCWSLRRRLPRSDPALLVALARTSVASLAMVPVVLLLLSVTPQPAGQLAAATLSLGGAAAGALTYLVVQRLLASPEATSLLAVAKRGRP
jgi:putative peptidoglycan lipid II flippase